MTLSHRKVPAAPSVTRLSSPNRSMPRSSMPALVVVTTPDECFRTLKADDFLRSKESVTVVDCWRCLDPSVTNHPEINYVPLGRCLDDAPAASVLEAIWTN